MDFQPAKEKAAVVPCAVFLSWLVLMFFSLFRMGISHFRIGTCTLPVFIEADIELHDE